MLLNPAWTCRGQGLSLLCRCLPDAQTVLDRKRAALDSLPCKVTSLYPIIIKLNQRDHIFDKIEKHPYYLSYTYATLIIFLALIFREANRILPF